MVRWPLPILAATFAVALVGLLTLPGYKPSYDDRAYLPSFIPANEGFAAADRHFSQARMKPEILMIESDHDMRNPADFLVLDKLAKGIFRVPGISRVQAITRPDGTAMDHTSIPFQISMQNAGQVQTMKYQRDRMNDMLKQADEMAKTIATDAADVRADDPARRPPRTAWSATPRRCSRSPTSCATTSRTSTISGGPIRSYFYWEKHCFDIPICWSLRSIFDALDGLDQINEKLNTLVG